MRASHIALAVAGSLLACGPATAALLNFELAGDYEASWQLDANPTVSASADSAFLMNDVAGIFSSPGGVLDIGDLIFFEDGYFRLHSGDGTTLLFAGFGPKLYEGPTSAPTFFAGIFEIVREGDEVSHTLTVTEAVVPEPATWAMLLAGFGAVGYTMRRRRIGYRFAHPV